MKGWARAALAGLLALSTSAIARADEPLKAKVGVLRLQSSAPVFIAQDKGYFRDAGLDVELKFFDAAQPIAVATTSGDVDFGITAFTAGLYNLAGKGTLKVIGGMSREKAGYPLIGYFASNNAYAAGLKTPKELAGKRIAVTQVGSSFHYSLGLLADKYGFKLSDVKIVPLQSLSNAAAALKGETVDAALLPISTARKLMDDGGAKFLGWVGDETPWQLGAVFASPRTLTNAPLVTRLLAALARDPLLMASAPAILTLAPGTEMFRQAMRDALRSAVGDRLNDATLDKVIRNAASSWTQSGHLRGRGRC